MTLQLENGDCLELMKSLPDKSVDLLVCDLPYGQINRQWDSIIDMSEFWKQFKRIRKSKRVACIHFCTTKFGYSLIKSWEKGFKMDMVWKKRQKTGALSSRFRPMRDHEMIYFFYEQAPKYNRDKYHKKIKEQKPNPDGASETDKSIYGMPLKDCVATASYDVPNPASVIEDDDGEKDIYGMPMGHPGGKCYDVPNPGSVVEGDEGHIGRHHVTQKPQSVLEFLLKYWSDEGDVVLDPTMGGGSTGVACKTLGRNFIGYEKDTDIYEIACARINDA
jgi:site-specific DNA-methyltransferase (adenine-specific)